ALEEALPDLHVVVEPALVGEFPLLAERNGEVRGVAFDENDLHEVCGREKCDDLHTLGKSSAIVLGSDVDVEAEEGRRLRSWTLPEGRRSLERSRGGVHRAVVVRRLAGSRPCRTLPWRRSARGRRNVPPPNGTQGLRAGDL